MVILIIDSFNQWTGSPNVTRGHRGSDRMVAGFTTTYMQSVPFTTDVVSPNLDQVDEYNIMWSSLSVTCDRTVVFSGSSGSLHQ